MDPLSLALLIGGGISSIIGAHSASSAANQQNQRISDSQNQLYGLAQQDRSRQNALTQLFLPSVLRDMRVNYNPQQLGNLFQQAGSGQPTGAAGSNPYLGQPSTPIVNNQWKPNQYT